MRLFVLALLLCSTFGLKAQAFQQQLDSLNADLKFYSTLSPFSDDERAIDKIDSVSALISQRLLLVLSDKEVLKHQLSTLFAGDVLQISESPDHKLFFISYDEKTGGTYRTSVSFVHYRSLDGTVKVASLGGDEEGNVSGFTYETPFVLNSKASSYLVIGSVVTCSSCIHTEAMTVSIDNSGYHASTIAKFDGRAGNLVSFEYDPKKQVLSLVYFPPDKEDLLYGDPNSSYKPDQKITESYVYKDGVFQKK